MIVLRYKGGLGNQMFIYAMQRALEKRCPGVPVAADISRYMLHPEHNGYELDRVWGIELTYAGSSDVKRLSPYLYPGPVIMHSPGFVRDYICRSCQHRYYDRTLERMRRDGSVARYYKQEDHHVYDPSVYDLISSGDCYLDGLWQNLLYFEDVETEVRRAFSMTDESGRSRFEDLYTDEDRALRERIVSSDSVSIHIRRGDFVESKFDICGMKYYRAALERAGSGELFVFTDEPDYASEVIPAGRDFTVVGHGASLGCLDMELMSLCRHHIISNSTYSWWAAWLSDTDGETIAPLYSLYNHDRYYPLSVPSDWIQLEV